MTHKRQIDLIDASSEDPKCQPRVKEEVEECVPAISADANHAEKEGQRRKVTSDRHSGTRSCFEKLKKVLSVC